MQKLAPDGYAALELPDQWIEDIMQKHEAAWIVDKLRGANTVLELGHGSGIVAAALRDAGKRVTVVEGAADFIGRTPGVEYIHTLFEDFEPIVKYDCVVASFVLEHVADPVSLLTRISSWSKRLITVVGNANSWHRQVAVEMGLQPALNTLSARDHAVGHHLVYDYTLLDRHLALSGWMVSEKKGLMLKPLNNALMVNLPREVIEGFCRVEVPFKQAANIGCYCYAV